MADSFVDKRVIGVLAIAGIWCTSGWPSRKSVARCSKAQWCITRTGTSSTTIRIIYGCFRARRSIGKRIRKTGIEYVGCTG